MKSLTITAVAALIGRSRQTVYNHLRAGKLADLCPGTVAAYTPPPRKKYGQGRKPRARIRLPDGSIAVGWQAAADATGVKRYRLERRAGKVGYLVNGVWEGLWL